jgi:hypothetical protein
MILVLLGIHYGLSKERMPYVLVHVCLVFHLIVMTLIHSVAIVT